MLIGAALFSSTMCRLIAMLPFERGALIAVTRDGTRDLHNDEQFLLRESIAEASTGDCRRREAIMLTPAPARCCVKSGQVTRVCRLRERGRITLQDHIVVSLQGRRQASKRSLRDVHAAREQRGALQQGHRDAAFAARAS
jgi:hypothetical protein